MRVLLVGAGGTIGGAVARALSARHEVVGVGKTRGAFPVDIASPEAVGRLYEWAGRVDGVVCAAGEARFGPLERLSDEDFRVSLASKLMGQVHLVRLGLGRLADGGSFTLTTGVLAREPTPGSGAISLVNAGLEGFVRAAALEMPRGIRINAVSPPWVAETLAAMGRDAATGMPAAQVAAAYVESVEGRRNGEILDARKFGERGGDPAVR